ncbi:MAG TPA: NAD-dependent succinate-semialdehyde dehydrogenase [Rhodospirillaceae bacterium]|nr:NAD-dependent succinate-semialdehyde dehydrogenase [Rhodospirillaceae bacterium]
MNTAHKDTEKSQHFYPDLQLIINGEYLSRDGAPVINPSTGESIADVPFATEADLASALEAAAQGFKIWSEMSPAKRETIMRDTAALLRERADEIAQAITLEQGKPVAQSKVEIMRACEIIEWDASEGRRTYGRVIPSQMPLTHTVLRKPIGPVAALSPWNFPMNSPGRKVAGALAAGCSIILKASEETPAGAFELVRAYHDAGVPPGVVNLVFGVPSEISEYLIASDVTRLITFTGSIPVGKHLAGLAAKQMKPTIMELGGHAPVLVDEAVDPVEVAKTCVMGKSRNAGQVCVSPTRFLVHDGIYDSFLESFVEKANSLKIGDGFGSDIDMGPVANDRRLTAMQEFVADATDKGAELAAGGHQIGNQGYFHEMTVLANVPDDARVSNEEPFGPLAIVNKVGSMDDAIDVANRLPYGLASYAFTNSADVAEQLAHRVESGNLSLNHLVASVAETPFGGVKESGYGREGGTEGLDGYTVVKNVSHLTSTV